VSLQTFADFKNPIPDSGKELRPHYILERFGIVGTALIAWQGPTDVKTAELVDWIDRRGQETIVARSMVHFLGEFFGPSLREIVLFQRLWITRVAALIGGDVEVKGNDLFGPKKLSVSIATASPVSCLIHLGVNIDSTGAPVPASGLLDRGWTPTQIQEHFVPDALRLAAREWDEVNISCAKVRPVL
jgi:hypothetical protein